METQKINELRVGDIVARNYHAAGVLQKHGIDFCCGGGISLEKACQNKGLDVDKVASELFETMSIPVGSGENYQDWTPSFLIDYIINTHHKFVNRKLEEIGHFSAKVARVYGETHPWTKEIFSAFLALTDEMVLHMKAEEEGVFPLIKMMEKFKNEGREIPDGLKSEFEKQVAQMEQEHDGAGILMKKIRNLSNDFTPPEDACTTYRILYQNLDGFEQDLHKHVHLENNILFKKAGAMIVG